MGDMTFRGLIKIAAEQRSLTETEMNFAMQQMLAGEVDHIEMASLLMALKMRGETVTEISAAAKAMRSAAHKISAPNGTIDTCGTGGDGANTYNVSTAVAFVLSACNVPVAKHGNKAVSSLSGSSDILSHLGVNLMQEFDLIERALSTLGIAFLFAQRHHPAVKNVAPVRASMGVRTIFNMLGPLTNPAGADFHLMGVYDQKLCRPIAEVLKSLGAKSAWVVHGSDGLDELTITGDSFVSGFEEGGDISDFTISPRDAGLEIRDASEIIGGDVATNAAAMLALFRGEKSAYRDIVILNAAAGLVVAGKCPNLKLGAELARSAIDGGQAMGRLENLIEASNATGQVEK